MKLEIVVLLEMKFIFRKNNHAWNVAFLFSMSIRLDLKDRHGTKIVLNVAYA